MADKIWKVAERKVAKWFGTCRNPLSGSNSRHSGSDTLHSVLFLEVKQSSKPFAVVSIWDRAREIAAEEGKTPVVALVQKSRPGFFVVVHCDDLVSVAQVRERVLQAAVDGVEL